MGLLHSRNVHSELLLNSTGLSDGESVSGAAAFAYQLLAILNGVSCFGHYFIGYIAEREAIITP